MKQDNYRYDTSFDVLVGIQYKDRISELTYINHKGEPYSNGICYAIGSGASFARVFLKGIDTENLTMKQFIEIGYFIIKYIEKTELDASIGVGYKKPQIWYIPNKYELDEKGNVIKNKEFEETNNLEELEKKSYKRINLHKKQLQNLFKHILD